MNGIVFEERGNMAAVLGTRKNPIVIGCAEVRKSNEKIDECIINIIKRKFGLHGQVFKDKRFKYVAIVIKTNDCDKCLLGMNTCKVLHVIIPKKAIEEKVALAV